ncbi:MAG TPA: tRNA (N6-threonylcarbamoyladenosine(37)-N6)-methyltransferase TrmO [Dehalococcoidales bacterium]|nr:tRNA (N6-threonylcarbamoyladenosine(37)-N6)-methyltransferase TrmO [Dehalococcoidales bacterium]
MTGELSAISLKPIGIVRNKVRQPPKPPYDWNKVVSEIEIDQSLTEAMDNLDEFSHITVFYWMHQVNTTEPPPTKVHPKGKLELPLVGLFATRSPNRPNPLGETTVRLLKRQENILKVKGLDAIDGTPVIDIKPYIPGHDSVVRAKVPRWVSKR